MSKQKLNLKLANGTEATHANTFAKISQANIKHALDAQAEQLDITVLSALNQRRQAALAVQGGVWRRCVGWMSASKFVLPAAVACGAAALVLTMVLRTAQPVISDADAALLADFDGTQNELLLDNAALGLDDDELAMTQALEFYAWLDQQKEI